MYRRFKCACGNKSTWCYLPSQSKPEYPYFCDDCVPRGCSCNHEFTPTSEEGVKSGFGEIPPSGNDWKWLEEPNKWCHVDLSGREFPCCEFGYDLDGYIVNKEELDFFRLHDIKYKL